jgi:hypothetical protein
MYVAGNDSNVDWRIEKRSLATGALDTNFGTAGVVTGAADSGNARSISIDSTWMYVAGNDSNVDWRIEKRSLATGALDTNFGAGGIVTGAAASSNVRSISIDSTWMYMVGNDSNIDWRIEKRSKESRPVAPFTNLTLNGSGGWNVPMGNPLVVSEGITLTNGTLGGTGDVVVRNGSISGNGALNMTGGTVSQRTGSFGGDPAWTLNNLNLGSAFDSIARTVTANGTGAVTVSGILNLVGNTTLAAGNKTWNLDKSGTPFVIGAPAAFDPQTSTVAYRRTTAVTNVTPVRYNNLVVNDQGTITAPEGDSTIFRVLRPTNFFNASWPYSRTVTIDSRYFAPLAGLSASTTIPVRVNHPDFRTTARGGKVGRADAGDVVFTVNGVQVPHDILRYDGEEGSLTAMFQARNFTTTAQPAIRLHYGNASAQVMENKALTWSVGTGTPYAGVWHLGEDPGATTTVSSAASSTWDGTYVNMGSANTQDGVFGRAIRFDGVNNRITLPQNLISNSATGSISMWFRTTGNGPLIGYQNQPVGTTPTNFVPILYIDTAGTLRGQVWDGSNFPMSATGVNNGQWRHVALTWNFNTQSLYLDGQLVGTRTGTISHGDRSHNQIGYAYFGGAWTNGWPTDRYFTGVIDEVRESTRARTAQDIFLEYETGRNAQFATVSATDVPTGLEISGNLTLSGASELDFDLVENNVGMTVGGTVTINANNVLTGPTSSPIIFRGDLTNNGLFAGGDTSVIFAPSGDVMTISGSSNTQFATATAIAPGKTIQFKNDSAGNFTQFARMIFSGLPGLPLTLQSTSQGSKWNLNLLSLVGSSLANVAIRDGGCHSTTARFPTNESILNLGNSDDCWGFTVRGTGSTVTGGGGTPQGGGGQGGGGAPNIALNMTVSASSNNEGTFGSYRLTDGSRGPQPWVSGTGLPQTATIDLGERYTINAVNLFWESSFTRTFTIQVSDDLSSWTTISTVTSDTTQNPALTGLSGQGRYVRLNVTSSAQGDQRLNEMEVYGTVTSGGGGPPQGGGGGGGGGGAAP